MTGERREKGERGGRFAFREMGEDEVRSLLERNWWANLATAVDGRPYAVPVVYGWDGREFYVINRPGRKSDALDSNPAVCLTIVEVEGRGEDWMSVVVEGRAETIRDPRGYLKAVRALRRQVGKEGPPPTASDAARLVGTRVIRIVPETIAGRRKA